MAFQGADIYSLISGMYPILADDVETGYSQSREVRQNIANAPSIYNISTATRYDPRQFAGSTSVPRKPYLQGNRISFTSATNVDDLGTISNMTEQGLLRDVAPSFATRTGLMQAQAHMTIMGAIQNRVGTQQAAIDRRAKSLEEQTNTDRRQAGRLKRELLELQEKANAAQAKANELSERSADLMGDQITTLGNEKDLRKSIQDQERN